ncbi:phage tail tape measure protein [Escherichia coli]|nr:phage tail tape measure protein [Escherichia coli]
MAEPVGDLVVDLSLDAARFDEQMARVRRHFPVRKLMRKTAAVVEQSLSRQALAAQKAGISVGQYKAAMRMLPAQFTDVATQLAGGQSPWLILLQQGGQVKDSFGGMIPMFRGLPVRSPCRWWGHLAGGGDRCAGVCPVSGQLNPVRFQQNAGPFRQSGGTDGRSYSGPVQSRAGGRADV